MIPRGNYSESKRNPHSVNNVYSEKMSEHDDALLSVDVHPEKQLILTSAEDGLVKIWNSRKDLLREIKFNEPITQALFLNHDADVVVAHGGQLTVIYAEDYKPWEIFNPSRE
jgi:WD40 repeat protein